MLHVYIVNLTASLLNQLRYTKLKYICNWHSAHGDFFTLLFGYF